MNTPCADTDGDGMNDGFEVNVAHSNPFVRDFDGTIIAVDPEIKGNEVISFWGDWTQEGGIIYAGNQGGYVDYPLLIPSNSMFVVAVEVTQHNPQTGQDVFNMSGLVDGCLLYTSPSPRDRTRSRMPSSA